MSFSLFGDEVPKVIQLRFQRIRAGGKYPLIDFANLVLSFGDRLQQGIALPRNRDGVRDPTNFSFERLLAAARSALAVRKSVDGLDCRQPIMDTLPEFVLDDPEVGRSTTTHSEGRRSRPILLFVPGRLTNVDRFQT
jgi:hypothetical protein